MTGLNKFLRITLTVLFAGLLTGCSASEVLEDLVVDPYLELTIHSIKQSGSWDFASGPDVMFTIDFNDRQTVHAPDQGYNWPDVPADEWQNVNWTYNFDLSKFDTSATVSIKMWDWDDLTGDDLMAGETLTFNPIDAEITRSVTTRRASFVYSLRTVRSTINEW